LQKLFYNLRKYLEQNKTKIEELIIKSKNNIQINLFIFLYLFVFNFKIFCTFILFIAFNFYN